jgi:hypothetical protein
VTTGQLRRRACRRNSAITPRAPAASLRSWVNIEPSRGANKDE